MRPAAVRLALVTALFVAWIGYLAFLVATRPVTAGGTPLALSRPQVLTSTVDVIAEISDPQGEAIIQEVLWPSDAPLKAGESIKIDGIAECHPPGQAAAPDWSGPGPYLVPLVREDGPKGGWKVAPIPSSPGFSGLALRIYPATAEVLAQYRAVRKPE
jgi:hypothetical protein